MKTREKYIDILKVVGLLCIMLAHVNPSNIVFQLRNFDVVLMILISAYLGEKSKETEWHKYLGKRFKRLIIPTWIFLTLFFIISFFTNLFQISVKNIIGSYALSNIGTGYVWVIRIYFIIAIMVLLHRLLAKKTNIIFINILGFALLVINEVLCGFRFYVNNILEYLLAYIAPCFMLVVIAKGMFEDKRKNISITLISLCVFIVCAIYLYKINFKFVPTQKFKYPFRVYYLSYGLALSGFLIQVLKNTRVSDLIYNKVIGFISTHSLWIYLWHILIVYILKMFNISWYFKFLILLSVSMMITYIQSVVIDRLERKISPNILSIFRG